MSDNDQPDAEKYLSTEHRIEEKIKKERYNNELNGYIDLTEV